LYISSLNQQLTGEKQLCYNNDKCNRDCYDVCSYNTSQMKHNSDFKFWCLEGELDANFYGIFIPLNLPKEEQIIDLSKNQHYEYALNVSYRWRCLNEGLASLQVIQKMLMVRDYPIDLENGVINRHEWFRITYDLILFRFASLRDYAYQLTNSVFELNLSGLDVNLRKIKNKLNNYDSYLLYFLDKIRDTGKNLRDDRNELAHEGFFSGIEDEGLEIRKAFSIIESDKTRKGKFNMINIGDKEQRTSDENLKEFQDYYNLKLEKLYKDLIIAGDSISQILNDFCDKIAPEFKQRFDMKQ